jgi:CheY-like chemotaxis protein
MLNVQGYRCDVVSSGEAAQALLSRDYDASLGDVRMAEVDGAALFEWLCEHTPHLRARVAILTGDTLGAGAGGCIARSVAGLRKTFRTSRAAPADGVAGAGA